MGKLCKLDYIKIMDRLKKRPDGKYIEVTAITPTPLGEGKSTTSMGLIEGLGKRGKNVGGCLRQPSGGPTMNVKGTAAGGGKSLLIPMTEFSLGLTGDINDIVNAHNLAMVALTSRMQHERNYDDAELAKRKLKTARHRSDERGNGLDHGFLRPVAPEHRHRPRGQAGRLHDAIQVRHRGELRAHGHSCHRRGTSRTSGSGWATSSSPMTRRGGRLRRPTSKWRAPCAHG